MRSFCEESFAGGSAGKDKGEIWKQRAYLQVEDNMETTRLNQEALANTPHSLLVGRGRNIAILEKFGIDLAVFYRVNQENVRPGGSPC